MRRTDGSDGHERFRELCALVQTDALERSERLDLERHLQICGACREVHDQYSAIGAEGMAFLSQSYALPDEVEGWNDNAARAKLLSSIRDQKRQKIFTLEPRATSRTRQYSLSTSRGAITAGLIAACLMIAVGLGAFQLGLHKTSASSVSLPMVAHSQPMIDPQQISGNRVELQNAQIAKLQQQIASRDQELARLKAGASFADARVAELETQNKDNESSLRLLTEERDRLVGRMGEIDDAYQKLQTDYTKLKTDYSHSLLHTASLESQVSSMAAANRQQDQKIKDDEQFLVSDRDIRELMGARKLYIADVFDVDSASHTRKPFGRVFYTQSKSLVFYAFDLDHQPGVKNASDFQVWGQRDSESSGASHPMNLGILYLDSESNRRWVLRSDDPRQLAEIDAVFVTVEPHGGSQKPSGKPLLYALLRKEANHP
jgi:hypothetical protein